MSVYLLTGVAGFIGSRVAEFLLADGHAVYGIANMNDAYDVRLKEDRLAKLIGREGFHYRKWDIADQAILKSLHEWLLRKYRGDKPGRLVGTRLCIWIQEYIDTNLTARSYDGYCRTNGVSKFVMASPPLFMEQGPPAVSGN